MRYGVLVIALAGCSLYFGDGKEEGPPPPDLTPAERAWVEQAQPVFAANCQTCHAGSVAQGMNFLAGNTVWEQRDSLLDSGMVNLGAPESSRILTKGWHSGPAMTAQQASAILSWIVAERDERL